MRSTTTPEPHNQTMEKANWRGACGVSERSIPRSQEDSGGSISWRSSACQCYCENRWDGMKMPLRVPRFQIQYPVCCLLPSSSFASCHHQKTRRPQNGRRQKAIIDVYGSLFHSKIQFSGKLFGSSSSNRVQCAGAS